MIDVLQRFKYYTVPNPNMVRESALGNVITFMDKIGVYDVVLPFLLVFTLVFAILERSRILGTEGKDKDPRKNLNAIVAFVISFLVVASSKLVESITQISSQITLLIMLSISFLMTVGLFHQEGELWGDKGLKEGWKTTFLTINFIGVLLIFLTAIKTPRGTTWLEEFWNWLGKFYTSAAVGTVILLVVIIVFVGWVIAPSAKKKEDKA